jgi:predicted PP-loop superfamily ATPase
MDCIQVVLLPFSVTTSYKATSDFGCPCKGDIHQKHPEIRDLSALDISLLK